MYPKILSTQVVKKRAGKWRAARQLATQCDISWYADMPMTMVCEKPQQCHFFGIEAGNWGMSIIVFSSRSHIPRCMLCVAIRTMRTAQWSASHLSVLCLLVLTSDRAHRQVRYFSPLFCFQLLVFVFLRKCEVIISIIPMSFPYMAKRNVSHDIT